MTYFNQLSSEAQESIKYQLINTLDYMQVGTAKDEIHFHAFNEDYFIIGYSECEKWIESSGLSAFDIIGNIQEYENSNFGEVNTKLDNPESVVNMFAYIVGEELIYDLDSFEDAHENLRKVDINRLKYEVENM